MCMMCNDEASYRAYLAYLDYIKAEEAAGREPDIDKALDIAAAALEGLGITHPTEPKPQDAPSPLSPFYCEPVQK